VANPARGRHGGHDGAPGAVHLDDGTPFDAKGKQPVPQDRTLVLELPGGGGLGDPSERDPDATTEDLAQGYAT